ncbi:hypothetical protein NHX12_005998 [Muraenolepis orangiensis]|uniref:Transcription factor 25 n=1 Tax=Muraenolepis orangiensis TaxID=630683 RepID=A0A9Q0ICH2_9TELE|nr:hypothetical protein NHX12_005998 [Muraenolepis orangiensis]
MSSRALRRLKGKQRGQEALDLGDLGGESQAAEDEEEEEEPLEDVSCPPSKNHTGRKAKKNKTQKNISNMYELICDAEKSSLEDESEKPEEVHETDDNKDTENTDGPLQEEKSADSLSGAKVKKKKKKKNKKVAMAGTQEDVAEDDIDALLKTIEDTHGLTVLSEESAAADGRPAIYVEHRHLNPETELKRYFGARAVLGDQRPRQRQRQFHRTTWMTIPKDTWPRFSRPGISMSLLHSKDGLHYFTFEHSRDYQQVQYKFMDAVDSMNNNNILTLLLTNPYHLDSLLQLSDVCRIHEDPELARELIERALYSFECSFHPLFSLTSGTCRLDFLRPENRAFYLALYKHMMFLENRGCPRTALEYCKLILSLDPESDPFCMLLLIDFLALRSREYHFILRLYLEWEEHRNLSQLPNFAFSVALCYFHLSQEEDTAPEERVKHRKTADQRLQHALIMFPGLLMPLLHLCTVQPDAAVSSHIFFGPKCQLGQASALAELTSLYVGRNHLLWKEAGVLLWLEECVKEVLLRVDANDPLVEEGLNKRKQRYKSAPRAIHRHVLLSEVKEAIVFLPPDVRAELGMGFDPLPPLDSVTSYTRPERPPVPAPDESTLSLFFRSLLPNFNLQGEPRPEENQEVVQAGRELYPEVNRLMVAMRDVLANIQFQEPPREDQPDRDEEEWN